MHVLRKVFLSRKLYIDLPYRDLLKRLWLHMRSYGIFHIHVHVQGRIMLYTKLDIKLLI